MSAARVIPPVVDTVQTINITSTGASVTVSPQGVIIAAGEQVNFSNSSSSQFPVSITFNPNPPGPPAGSTLFTNISNLAAGASNQQTAPMTNGAVNYNITANGRTFGPFAIQVGSGPLYIQIVNSMCTPDPAAIPPRGSVEMYSADSGSTAYNVNWAANGDPFNPPIQQAATGMGGNVASTASTTLGSYAYSVLKRSAAGNGGGTIKIKGS